MSSGEKYVAAAYGVFVVVVLVWVAILAAKLSRLERETGELAQLAEQVAALAGAAAGGGDSTRVAADAQALAERVRAAASREVRATVFLQYGGGATAELVTGLTARLRDGGYIVPVAEALPTDAHEVRYFHAPDRDAASALAKDTMEALKALGGPPVLVAEADGELWAAVSVDDSHVIANPFRPSGELAFGLLARARELRRAGRGKPKRGLRVWRPATP